MTPDEKQIAIRAALANGMRTLEQLSAVLDAEVLTEIAPMNRAGRLTGVQRRENGGRVTYYMLPETLKGR